MDAPDEEGGKTKEDKEEEGTRRRREEEEGSGRRGEEEEKRDDRGSLADSLALSFSCLVVLVTAASAILESTAEPGVLQWSLEGVELQVEKT